MAYKPADHEETTSVAPLLQFFELVHVGDTIQSMVQVYFDKELVRAFLFRFCPPLFFFAIDSRAAYRPHISTVLIF